MDVVHRPADQVRVPRVRAGEAVIVTRHGEEVVAVISVEDFRRLELLDAAIAATGRPFRPVGSATLAAEAGDLADDEFPDDAEAARILGERA